MNLQKKIMTASGLAFITLLAACGKNNTNAVSSSSETVATSNKVSLAAPSLPANIYFKSGFEAGVSKTLGDSRLDTNPSDNVQIEDIAGGDVGSYNWLTTLENGPSFNDFFINYEKGVSADRNAEILDDPIVANRPNKVLRFFIKRAVIPYDSAGQTGYKGRVQTELNQSKTSTTKLTEFYETIRILYPKNDWQALVDAPGLPGTGYSYINMFEFRDDSGSDHEFRMEVLVTKPSSPGLAGQNLIFTLKGENHQIGEANYMTQWTPYKSPAIPLDKWMTLKIYFKQGNASTGRFYMTYKLDGSTTETVLFDVTNQTYSDRPKVAGFVPDGYENFGIFKLYSSADIPAAFNKAGKTMKVYYDDLTIYKR